MQAAHLSNGGDRLADALQFYRSVLQSPLQPPAGCSNGPLFNQQHSRQAQQQRTSVRGFTTQQQPHWRQSPQQQQQQGQQPHTTTSVPPQQQQQQQYNRQQHGHSQSVQIPDSAQASSRRTPWPPKSAPQQGHVYDTARPGSNQAGGQQQHQHMQQQQDSAQQHNVQYSAAPQGHVQQSAVQQQQQAVHRASGQFQSVSPTGRMFAGGGTPAHADAQLQPTPTPHAGSWNQQQREQEAQWQMQQQDHKQAPFQHQHKRKQQQQQQQQPLQDVLNLLLDEHDAPGSAQQHQQHPHRQQQQQQMQQQRQEWGCFDEPAWEASAAGGQPDAQVQRPSWQHQQRQQHQWQHQQEHGVSGATPQPAYGNHHHRQQQQQQLQQQQQCDFDELEQDWPEHAQQQQQQHQQARAGATPQAAYRQQQQQQQQQRLMHRPKNSLLLQRLASWGDSAEEQAQTEVAAGAAQGSFRQHRSTTAAAGSSKSTSRWPWLGKDRRDAQGRQPGTPGYDPSTLYIPPAALAAMSDFGRQFWGIKCRAMDLVLFVRHGSFYNLFDVDADVGLRVGLNLSGQPAANMWKVGCHINQFAVWAAKVLAQGYSVGRVEEMPTAPGRAGPNSSSSKLLVRQLVRIYTPGTAVEGLLLDDQDEMPHPLMCLVEMPYSTAPQHTYAAPSRTPYGTAYSNHPTPTPTPTAHAVGICILDISSGVCRVGTFSTADDPARSALAVALLMCDPSEAVAVRNSLAGSTVTFLKHHFEIKTAAGPGFGSSGSNGSGSSGSDGGCGDRMRGQVPGVSWLPVSAAGNVLTNPTGSALEGTLSDAQLQQLQQIAAQAAASSSSSSVAAEAAAAAAVLAAVGVGVKQLGRCSLLADVLPTMEVQPLEALTAHGGVKPGRPLLLDNNAIITLDLLPLSHISSSAAGAGPTALAAAAAMKGAAASSLFGLLDRTASAAGKRKLRQWICRPLTVASAINERLDVLDLFLQLPTAASGLQQKLSVLPDADRLLPKAAAAVRALLQQQQHAMDAQQQLDPLGVSVVDPMLEGSAAQRQRAWKALAALPTCILGLIQAVAALRSEAVTHTNTAKLPLLRRAELAAAKAVAPAKAVHRVLASATWADATTAAAAAAAAAGGVPGAGKGRGKKGAAAAAAAAAAGEDAGSSSSSGIQLAPGADDVNDAAAAEQQHLQDSYEAELQAQLQWYSNRGSSGGWGQQQQQWQQRVDGVGVREVYVVSEAEGVIALVVKLPAAAAAAAATSAGGFWGQPCSTEPADISDMLAELLAPGHLVVKQELLTDGQDSMLFNQQQQQGSSKPPTGRGTKAAAGRGGGGRGRKGAAGKGPSNPAAAAAAAAGGDEQSVLLHVYVPDLQQMWEETQAAEQQVAAAAAAALDRVAQTFLGSYGVFRSLVGAVADLDVLAGFAQVVCTGNAPPGCSFCRPQFAAAAAAAAAGGLGQEGGSSAAPLLQLDGLWHPLLGLQSSGSVVPNDVVLGGHRPGVMLLTGANMGGKSTLLRSTCVAVIMAQLGCYVAASSAVVEPVDAIFTRIGAADAIMCGKSTFMVEMSETAACLAAATPASLIVLDELGRGTSTHDGYVLAYAVLRHLACPNAAGAVDQHQQLGSSSGRQLPRVLFATHYHMLTQEADLQDCTQSCHMSTRWDQAAQQLVHCYKLQPGLAPTGSCGIEVAALAGLPSAVVQRAAAVAAVMQQHCEGGLEAADEGLIRRIHDLS